MMDLKGYSGPNLGDFSNFSPAALSFGDSGGPYTYDWTTGNYINSQGEIVPYSEVKYNYLMFKSDAVEPIQSILQYVRSMT